MNVDKSDRRLLATGIVGSVIAALCCFTPVLAVLFGLVGMSAVLGWADVVLLPALGFFIGLTIYAVWRRQRNYGILERTVTSRPSQPSWLKEL